MNGSGDSNNHRLKSFIIGSCTNSVDGRFERFLENDVDIILDMVILGAEKYNTDPARYFRSLFDSGYINFSNKLEMYKESLASTA